MEPIFPDQEIINQPLKHERDISVVKLSQVIGEIKSALQNNTLNIKHYQDFKESFVRLTNLTMSDSKLENIKFLKTDKSLIAMVEKIRNENTDKSNIEQHIKIACLYFNALFSTGTITI